MPGPAGTYGTYDTHGACTYVHSKQSCLAIHACDMPVAKIDAAAEHRYQLLSE